jgi:type IV pilus assembly protein PilN
MIRINLLPVRAAKKKESAVQQITIFFVSLLLMAAVVMCLYLVKRVQVSSAQNDIASANIRIMELKKKIGKLEELKTLKDQVKKKLDVLVQLRKNKTGPAERLSTLSDITPEQLWLTGYTENVSDVKLSGIAYTEELIATFMRSLEASPDFTGVELVVSEQLDAGGTKVKKFELTCKLKAPVVPQPEAAPKK